MSKRTPENGSHQGNSKRQKLELTDMTALEQTVKYRKALTDAIYAIFGTNKSADSPMLAVGHVHTKLMEAGLWVTNEQKDKCREMNKVLEESLTYRQGAIGEYPSYRLRDHDQALREKYDKQSEVMGTLEFKLHTLSTDKEGLTKLVASLRAQTASLEFDVQDLREQLRQAKKIANENGESLARLGTELPKKIREKEAELKQAQERAAQAEASRAQPEKELATARLELEKLRDELKQGKYYRERVEDDLRKAVMTTQEYRMEIAQFKENAESSAAEVKALGNTLEREVQHNKQLQEEKDAINQQKLALEEKLRKLEDSMSDEYTLEKKAWNLGQEVRELKEEIERLRKLQRETEEAGAQAEKDLEEEIELTNTQAGELQRLLEEVASMTKELRSLRRELLDRTTENSAMAGEKKDLETAWEIARSDKQATEDILEATYSSWEAVEVTLDGNFHHDLQMGDFVALTCPDSDAGGNYWLASIIGTRPSKRGREIHVMYYEEAGDRGYRGWANGKTQWVSQHHVVVRINRLPVTAEERECLQQQLHAPAE